MGNKEYNNLTKEQLLEVIEKLESKKKYGLVYLPAKSVPTTSLSPLYYWEAERALQRNILNFYFN